MAQPEKLPENDRPYYRRRLAVAVAAASLLIAGGVIYGVEHNGSQDNLPPKANSGQQTESKKSAAGHESFPEHHSITATMFWAGEPPDPDNKGITNVSSAWVDNWVKEFGGVDDPDNRCGFRPCAFVPKENAFYFALPFNDYDSFGHLKPEATLKQIPWYSKPPEPNQSLVKNRWIAVEYKGKTVYGQWEDVGPFGEDDMAYVFGQTPPKVHAGLDLSPAMNDYLRLDGEGIVSWRFVDAQTVPNGPWKQVVTTSGLNY